MFLSGIKVPEFFLPASVKEFCLLNSSASVLWKFLLLQNSGTVACFHGKCRWKVQTARWSLIDPKRRLGRCGWWYDIGLMTSQSSQLLCLVYSSAILLFETHLTTSGRRPGSWRWETRTSDTSKVSHWVTAEVNWTSVYLLCSASELWAQSHSMLMLLQRTSNSCQGVALLGRHDKWHFYVEKKKVLPAGCFPLT